MAVIIQWVYLINRDRPLELVLRDAHEVWTQFEALMLALSDDMLLTPARFEWMEGRALGLGLLHNFIGHLHVVRLMFECSAASTSR